MELSIKVRENRLRRMASRQGYRLQKSRRRDPRALGFGTFTLVKDKTNASSNQRTDNPGGNAVDVDLDEIEQVLRGESP